MFQFPTHFHGHILDLVLTPTDGSRISKVRVAEFISDHALVLAQLDSVNPPSQKTNVTTFRRYHKIDTDSLHNDLGNCSFIRYPVDTVSVLCKQYLSNLSKLLDKHAPLVTHTSYWLAIRLLLAGKTIRRQWKKSGIKINQPTIKLDYLDRWLLIIRSMAYISCKGMLDILLPSITRLVNCSL